jgi:hypothetical protein
MPPSEVLAVHTQLNCAEGSLLYAALSRTLRNRGLRVAVHRSNFSSVHFDTSV